MVAPAYPGDFGKVIADLRAQINGLWAAVRTPPSAKSATPILFATPDTSLWTPITSSSFVDAFEARVLLQQPNISVIVRIACPAATTAAVQLYDVDNSAVVASGTAAASATTTVTLAGAVSGAPLDVRNLAVQARLTAGTGTVLVDVLAAYGTQT